MRANELATKNDDNNEILIFMCAFSLSLTCGFLNVLRVGREATLLKKVLVRGNEC